MVMRVCDVKVLWFVHFGSFSRIKTHKFTIGSSVQWQRESGGPMPTVPA